VAQLVAESQESLLINWHLSFITLEVIGHLSDWIQDASL
jgi:hypothetical protein